MSAIGTLFDLPASFFASAALAETDSFSGHILDLATARARTEQGEAAVPAESICRTCAGSAGLHFSDFRDFREHCKSDWHRCNVKRKAHGRAALDESSFDALVGGEQDEISSISGSESSDDEGQPHDRSPEQGRQHSTARIAFHNEDQRFAVWRVLLGQDLKAASPALLKQRLLALREDCGLWAVLLSRGGHFAGAVFAAGPSLQPHALDPKKGPAAPSFQAVVHKTFHRYVVRAKAGGKQSGKDATGKFAKSAGSQIRRYNEAALRQEILSSLQSWRLQLEQVSRIFIAAPGSNDAPIFEEASPLKRADPRIVGIPFPTKRPTFSEAKRVMATLLTVVEPEARPVLPPPPPPQEKKEAAEASTAPSQPKAADETARPAAVEEAEARSQPEPELHQASRRGDAAEVARLLAEGHDPTVTLGKTAYAVAGSKAVRDAFRRRMAEAPDQWDWTAADVPSPLTPEQEEQQLAKEAQKKAKMKEREKERKKKLAERKKAQQAGAAAAAEAEVTAAAAQAAAASSNRGKDAELKKVQRTQEDAARRREQMAAAAEARMAALRLASEQQKLW